MNQPGLKKNWPYLFIITILAALMLAESIRYHNIHFDDNWRREIYADGSGYFIYHHMWFEQGYQSKNYQDSLDALMGYGYSIKGPIIKNKYTCGVAYLQAPFVGGNKIASLITGKGGKPESRDTNRMVGIAAMFYAWLGAIFLFYFLSRYVRKWIAFISILLIFAGTNVFFYAVYQPGMAHIYSFFLFCFYLFIGDTWLSQKKTSQYILLTLTAFLIVLIRPTDILFLPVLLFLRNNVKDNLQLIFTKINLLIGLGAFILIWSPQCYYWYISTGNLVYYSYENEGFTNALHPKIGQVLFAPDNGLIPYSLLFFVLIGTNIYLIIKKHPYAIFFFIYQLITIYLIASWHVPNFGGAYGQRNFVQIFAGYAFILTLTLEKARKVKVLFTFLILVSLFAVAVNQKIMYKYQHFFFGRQTWDWREYWYYINYDQFNIDVNFDAYKEPERTIIEKNYNRVLNITPQHEFYHVSKFGYNQLPDYFKDMEYSMRLKPDTVPFRLELCMTWHKADSILFYKTSSLQSEGCTADKWKNIHEKTIVGAPGDLTTPDSVFIYLWNIDRKNFHVDDIKIRFE